MPTLTADLYLNLISCSVYGLIVNSRKKMPSIIGLLKIAVAWPRSPMIWLLVSVM
jgi:hypothetical protein